MPKVPRAVHKLRTSSVALAVAFGGALVATPCAAAEFFAGGYSFSDELGGFRLLSASGLGTPDDPIVVVEEIEAVAPVTLVVRHHDFQSAADKQGASQLTLVKQIVNRSNRVWAGFELELQEVAKKPSTYGDGLSFKQFAAEPPDVESDAFAANERHFEPADRIEFRNGHLDPGATARFKITITDPTPTREYYLVQDPKLLSAGLPTSGPSLAAVED